MDTLGKRLELLRNLLGEKRGKKKVPQEEMAKIVGVDKQTWWRYENNQREPDIGFLQNLVQKVNVNPLWLLTGKGMMFVEQLSGTWHVAEASAPYGNLTEEEREIIELLREDPELTGLCKKVLKNRKAFQDALAELQKLPDPSAT
jgi:transcriptional regulator with XRE-family HTH domain